MSEPIFIVGVIFTGAGESKTGENRRERLGEREREDSEEDDERERERVRVVGGASVTCVT